MAIYHFSAKFVQRSQGAHALASAAYRSASRLFDEKLGRHHDFTAKKGVVFSKMLLPPGAPERWANRQQFWNEVERVERRKNSQLAQEVEFALPRELSRGEAIRLARDFVQATFVDKGMVADLNVHWDVQHDGRRTPHAHVMLSTRDIRNGEFGLKNRFWGSREALIGWREAWSEFANARMEQLGIDARIDHRAFRDREAGLEPLLNMGPGVRDRIRNGEGADRLEANRLIARRNGQAIIANPEKVLFSIRSGMRSLTEHDIVGLLLRHTDGAEQFARARAALLGSRALEILGRDPSGDFRFRVLAPEPIRTAREWTERAPGMFASFRPSAFQRFSQVLGAAQVAGRADAPYAKAIATYMRAYEDVERMRRAGLPVLAHQVQALARAERAFAANPEILRSLRAELDRARGHGESPESLSDLHSLAGSLVKLVARGGERSGTLHPRIHTRGADHGLEL